MIGWLASKVFMMSAKANVKKLQNSPKLFGALEGYRKDTITTRIEFKITGTGSWTELNRAVSMNPRLIPPSGPDSVRYRRTSRELGMEVKFTQRDIEAIRKDWDLFPLEDIEGSGCRHSPDWKDGIKRLKQLKPGATLAHEARYPETRHRYLGELSKKWEKEFRGENQHPSNFTGEPSYSASYIYKMLTKNDHITGRLNKQFVPKKQRVLDSAPKARVSPVSAPPVPSSRPPSSSRATPARSESVPVDSPILKLAGRMKIGGFRKAFRDAFGSTLRVYKGKHYADDGVTIGSVAGKPIKRGTKFSLSPQVKVGRFEQDLWKHFELRVQVRTPDDSQLVDNELTLGESRKVKGRGRR
jgi:hypothetical protein